MKDDKDRWWLLIPAIVWEWLKFAVGTLLWKLKLRKSEPNLPGETRR